MAMVIMRTPFLIALLQIRLCKKGSNFVAGAALVLVQFVGRAARFDQGHPFAGRLWACSSPQAADHKARGGDRGEQEIPGNGYPIAGGIGSSRKISIPVGAHINRYLAGTQRARRRPAKIGRAGGKKHNLD
jgi:hypothetical protein